MAECDSSIGDTKRERERERERETYTQREAKKKSREQTMGSRFGNVTCVEYSRCVLVRYHAGCFFVRKELARREKNRTAKMIFKNWHNLQSPHIPDISYNAHTHTHTHTYTHTHIQYTHQVLECVCRSSPHLCIPPSFPKCHDVRHEERQTAVID